MYEISTVQAIRHAKWPIEFEATRVGVNIPTKRRNSFTTSVSSNNEDKKKDEFNRHLNALLDREMVHTDQVYRMPSPYLWQCLEEMEGRAQLLQGQLQSVKKTLEMKIKVSNRNEFDVFAVAQLQEQAIWKVANYITKVHVKIDQLRQLYNLHEKGDNVLEVSQEEEMRYQKQMDQQMKMMALKSLPTPAPTSGSTTTALTGSNLFGKPPATSTNLFGIAATTPSPASTGNLFSGTKPATPALGSSGNLFSANALASSSNLVGATAAPPSTGNLFGSSATTPAPASIGNLFGGTTTASPAPNSSGNLFGGAATVPPAPASTGNLFGGTTTTNPAPGSLFGGTATPKSKSRSRSSRRR